MTTLPHLHLHRHSAVLALFFPLRLRMLPANSRTVSMRCTRPVSSFTRLSISIDHTINDRPPYQGCSFFGGCAVTMMIPVHSVKTLPEDSFT